MTTRLPFPGGVTLIGGGEVQPDDLDLAREIAPGLIAADGGADHALQLGAMPDAVIGDLDSLSKHGRARIGAERLIHVAEQESTDFEKCLQRIDASFIIAIGFGGPRLDHSLAALNTLARRVGPPTFLLSGADVVFLCPQVLRLDLPLGMRLSLFPMGPARGTSSGLCWPIGGLTFAPDSRVGTSNEVSGPVDLRIDGPMLVILPREALQTVLRQLFF